MEPGRPIKSLKEYFSQLYIIFCCILMTWILATNDHKLIKYTYLGIMISLLCFRTISFFRRGFQYYLLEMCYVINIISLFVIALDYDIKIIYPFMHGPLMCYSLIYGDALIFNNLAKTTTYAIHSTGSIVTRRLYWNGDNTTFSLDDLTYDSFLLTLKQCMIVYFCWAIPYYIWLFLYNGNMITMVRYMHRVNLEDNVTIYMKVKYIVLHFFGITASLLIGIFSMYCWQFNYLMVGCQIVSGFVQGATYDFTGHRLNFMKLFFNTYTKIKNKKT